MKQVFKILAGGSIILAVIIILSSFYSSRSTKPSFRFPYKEAGLNENQAAAHLLSRFTFGATPEEIREVTSKGLEKWFLEQLSGTQKDDSLNSLLSSYDALKLNNTGIINIFPKPGQVIRMAIEDGAINKDSVKTDKKEYRDFLESYMNKKGMKPEKELYRQFISQKILRAAYSKNQLREVMTSFWFNHFNVSIVKNDCARFIPAYERDVIRPGALGKFDDLLLSTAKSPAMLYYLDNFTSTGADTAKRTGLPNGTTGEDGDMKATTKLSAQKVQTSKKAKGLNENYAREVMELHTLGVDGGYSQKDVTEAARVLTGWTVYPMNTYRKPAENYLSKLSAEQFEKKGYVRDGDFLFAANRHDKGSKVVLGMHFGPGGGYEEGVKLLDMLAHHPSTAKFICRKLAVRFVNDNPPQGLVNRMAKTFMNKDGDIREVLITMVTSPEFWNPSSVREKTKSPFELAVGAVRSLKAQVTDPYQLYNWISKMGEKIYFYQAPTGFPDKGQYWINTGSLLSRMNFGLALASGRIPGVKVNFGALNNNHEPESSQAALVTYSKLILPERNLDETIRRLAPMLTDPQLMAKVNRADNKRREAVYSNTLVKNNSDKKLPSQEMTPAGSNKMNNQMLAQVAGVIIGSPEYQRR